MWRWTLLFALAGCGITMERPAGPEPRERTGTDPGTAPRDLEGWWGALWGGQEGEPVFEDSDASDPAPEAPDSIDDGSDTGVPTDTGVE